MLGTTLGLPPGAAAFRKQKRLESGEEEGGVGLFGFGRKSRGEAKVGRGAVGPDPGVGGGPGNSKEKPLHYCRKIRSASKNARPRLWRAIGRSGGARGGRDTGGICRKTCVMPNLWISWLQIHLDCGLRAAFECPRERHRARGAAFVQVGP